MSVIFVHKAIDAATAAGNQDGLRAALFRTAGIDPDAPVDPTTTIPDTDFFALLEHLADSRENAWSVLMRIGGSMRCDDYGAFGLAFKSAPDLLGSYRRVERYGKIVTTIANFRLVPAGETVLMEVIPGRDARLGLAMTNELALAAAVSLSREVSAAAFNPVAIHLSRAAPEAGETEHGYFRCPVHIGSYRDALEVDRHTLARPNRLGDPGIAAFFDTHLDQQLSSLTRSSDLVGALLRHVTEALSEGVPTLDGVAGRLGLSRRTLQRRLADEDLAYQDLVTEARKTLADDLLQQTDYSLAEIAFLTGFSDQSAFTRAFKRWNGETPAHARHRR